MTALLLANKATFPLCSHLLFPTIYQCALIHRFVISHLRQDSKYAVCSDVPVCLHTPKSFLNGCVIVTSDVGGGGLWRREQKAG